MYIYVHIYVYISTYIYYIYIIHTHTHIYIYIYVCVCVSLTIPKDPVDDLRDIHSVRRTKINYLLPLQTSSNCFLRPQTYKLSAKISL